MIKAKLVQDGSRTQLHASKFYYKMLDLAMYQQVTEMTRIREEHHSSTLDYVFTAEQNTVEFIHYEVPLGKSNHVCLQWATKAKGPTSERN
jgi:hypothetical protein